LLSIRNLVLIAGGIPFSHDFAGSAITVVVGRNASGKTALTRVIAGLAAPVEGQLLLNDVDITRLTPGERSVALVTQAFVNYPNWTVRDNLASPMRAAGIDVAQRPQRIDRLARQLGLDDLLDRLPAELSGGQQQRLAIGRALAKDATVLVMDEPLVNLDYKLRETLTLELQTLLHEQSLTVIYTTSDSRDAFAMADEVLLLADHAPVQAGKPLAVYQSPASPIAADLMSDPGANRFQSETTLQLVRPEHLYLEQSDPRDIAFPATLLSRETNGSETFLHCEVAGAHWVVRLDGLVTVSEDRPLTLYAPAEAIIEFPEPAVG
jgi:glycerol transport system ATP-binding protein